MATVRQARGPLCRIVDADWAKCGPAKLTKENAAETLHIEPDDTWITLADFIEQEGCLPPAKGYEVETVIRKNGKKEMGCWVPSDAPLRRRHQKAHRS